jgi:DNA-binding CsgD family transcriptional regulator
VQETVVHDKLGEFASSCRAVPERAQAFLETVRELVGYDGAWLAQADPMTSTCEALVGVDLGCTTASCLSGVNMARDIEVTGANRVQPPLTPSDLAFPAEELPTWAECLLPAGYREALGVSLFASGGRQVGFLFLLSADKAPSTRDARRRLHRVTPILGSGLDSMRFLQGTLRLVRGARTGIVLRTDGRTQPIPGMNEHGVSVDAPLLLAAHRVLAEGDVYRSFLWPVGGPHAPSGHVRVTIVGQTDDAPGVAGVLVISEPPHCHGLTPREMEVLGLVIDGLSNREIATALVVTPRTVAAHVEHILVKLDAPTRTLAAVRGERQGCYVPDQRPAPVSAHSP